MCARSSTLAPTPLAKTGYMLPQLWEAWRSCARPRPNTKEIKECLAFFEKVRKVLGRRRLLVDAAGGHGALALAYGASGKAERAIVADLRRRASSFENLRAAWMPETGNNVQYEYVDLSHGNWLRDLIEREAVQPAEVAVVSVHACGALTDALIDACTEARVDFALMPCCHGRCKDRLHRPLRDAARVMGISPEAATDLARFGVIASRGYTAKVRAIDPAITPVNKILIGLCEEDSARDDDQRDRALLEISDHWRGLHAGNDVALDPS